MLRRSAEFRFHGPLNGYLAPERREVAFAHDVEGMPSLADRLESLGVPHAEVHLVLVDGEPVGGAHLLAGGESIAVYPRPTHRRVHRQYIEAIALER